MASFWAVWLQVPQESEPVLERPLDPFSRKHLNLGSNTMCHMTGHVVHSLRALGTELREGN